MDISVGDVLTLKKKHPCGGNTWKVLRVGADLRIECITCARALMIPRSQLEKNIKKIESNA